MSCPFRSNQSVRLSRVIAKRTHLPPTPRMKPLTMLYIGKYVNTSISEEAVAICVQILIYDCFSRAQYQVRMKVLSCTVRLELYLSQL